MPSPGSAVASDPLLAAILSFIVPGAGFAYAGRPRLFGIVLAIEILCLAAGFTFVLLLLHPWQALVSGGLAAENGERARGRVRVMQPAPLD